MHLSPDFSFVGLKNYIEGCFIMTNIGGDQSQSGFCSGFTPIQTTPRFCFAFAVYYMTPKWQCL